MMEEPKQGAEEQIHPPNLENATPETLLQIVYTAIGFLEKYGWFIVLAILVVLVIYEKLKPQIHKWWNHFEDYSNKKTDDPNRIFIQHESMENARRKLQERINRDAQEFKERQEQLEAEKRRQKIEDWERHQLGQGYRSKVKKPQDEDDSQGTIKPKMKPKKPVRRNDYNPLMGHGNSSGYKPSSRRGGSGGG